jgi:hypothetical protein
VPLGVTLSSFVVFEVSRGGNPQSHMIMQLSGYGLLVLLGGAWRAPVDVTLSSFVSRGGDPESQKWSQRNSQALCQCTDKPKERPEEPKNGAKGALKRFVSALTNQRRGPRSPKMKPNELSSALSVH